MPLSQSVIQYGIWTPTFTFTTPGDLSVLYATQLGYYTKINRLVFLSCVLESASLTFTTSSGQVLVGGIPFTPQSIYSCKGTCSWFGITKAAYTQLSANLAGSASNVTFRFSGSGQPLFNIDPTCFTSGTNFGLNFSIQYVTA